MRYAARRVRSHVPAALLGRLCLLGALLLLAIPSAAAAAGTEDAERLAGLLKTVTDKSPGIPVGPGLYRLHGTSPDLPDDDLEPLRLLLRRAVFVGLGESIHTNGGFYEMKHRLFRFLVEKMGFRAFGFESPWVSAEVARQYVATCAGSSFTAVRSLFAVWQSQETRELLEWMCGWNQGHPGDPVHFYGFDIQNDGNRNTGPLLAFLSRLGFGEGDPIVEGIQTCDGTEVRYYPGQAYPEALYQQCQGALSAAESYFDQNEPGIVAATSTADLAWARIHLVSAQSWQEEIFYQDRDFDRSFAARDRGMAYVAAAIRTLRFPNKRVALWAHNAHIMRNGPGTNLHLNSMGTFLDQAFGRRYASVALTAYDTFLEWPWVNLCGGPHHIFSSNPVEVPLHATGEETLLLAFDPPGYKTFFPPGTTHSIGEVGGVPLRHFDALVFLDQAPAMRPLFTLPPCP